MDNAMNDKYALNIADDGRVLSATFERYAHPDAVIVDELPEGDLSNYLWKDGEFVCDPLPKPEPEPSTESILLEMAADHEERLCMMELGI